MFIFFNPNPEALRVGDCTIRAISRATGKDWEDVYLSACLYGLISHDMPSSNYVWGRFLKNNGFTRHAIPDTCPDCYTVRRFADEHPEGTYILALSGHVVAVVNGNWYDTFDSGDSVPLYYWERSE